MQKLIPNLKEIDRLAIEEYGIPGLTLMETAGGMVARYICHYLQENKLTPYDEPSAVFPSSQTTATPAWKEAPVVILCGPGNNGGDGFVVARHLAREGFAHIHVLHTSNTHTGDANTNFEHLRDLAGVHIQLIERLSPDVMTLLESASIIVDGLFGSGLARNIDGVYSELIHSVNTLSSADHSHIIAIDIPSGVDGANGHIWGTALQADITITFATGKPGLYLGDGKRCAGLVQVVDIGIPEPLIEKDTSPISLLDSQAVQSWLPTYALDAHKYTLGHVLVIAGSPDMPGAAHLVSESALRSGAGVVTLATTNNTFHSLHLPPELLRITLPEDPNKQLATLIERTQDFERIDAIAIGPGLGQNPDTQGFIKALLNHIASHTTIPVVLDADGLNALAKGCPASSPTDQKNKTPDSEGWNLPNDMVFTPHLGEASRLLGHSVTSGCLIQGALGLQQAFEKTIVLKSASTLIATRDHQFWVNPTGNPGLATAGSGDVLTGMIIGFLARGLTCEQAAACGVYLHGLAGDYAAQELTPYAMTAGDLLTYFSDAFHHVLDMDYDG